MSLSKEKKFEYVDNQGLVCPYCGSNDLEGSSVQVDGPVITVEVSCLTCGEEWSDIYTLTSIYE